MAMSPDSPNADLTDLPRDALERLHDAAARIIEIQADLAGRGASVVSEVLRGPEPFEEWGHYPKGDHWDPETGGQYYYHAHVASDRVPGELGHFHVFLRPHVAGLAPDPAPVPDGALPEALAERVGHLVGISTDDRGRAFRLFTTNRWVCAETWYDAPTSLAFLDRFALSETGPLAPVNAWVAAMVTLFKGPIAALLAERDAAVADWAGTHPDSDVFEDRGLQVTSARSIDLAERIAAVEAALGLG